MQSRKGIFTVLTTASIAIGCSGSHEPVPPPENPPRIQPDTNDTTKVSEDSTKPAPYKLVRNSDNTCEKHFDTNCPEGAKCNPPAPEPVACPPEKGQTIVKLGEFCGLVSEFDCPPDADCEEPKPEAVDCPKGLKEGQRVIQRHNFGCAVKGDDYWQNVICPPELDRPLPDNVGVFAREDGTCWGMPQTSCPEGATCNPPPPTPVNCPPDKAPK